MIATAQPIAADALEKVTQEQPDAGFEDVGSSVRFADGSRLVALPADAVDRLVTLRPMLRDWHREATARLDADRNRLPAGEAKDEASGRIDALKAAHTALEDAVYKIAVAQDQTQ